MTNTFTRKVRKFAAGRSAHVTLPKELIGSDVEIKVIGSYQPIKEFNWKNVEIMIDEKITKALNKSAVAPQLKNIQSNLSEEEEVFIEKYKQDKNDTILLFKAEKQFGPERVQQLINLV